MKSGVSAGHVQAVFDIISGLIFLQGQDMITHGHPLGQLAQGGIFVTAGGGGVPILQVLLLGPLLSMIGSKKMGLVMAKLKKKDLEFLKDLLEAGKIVPVIDRRYPLSEVAGALRYLEEGHAQGKVVITVEQ